MLKIWFAILLLCGCSFFAFAETSFAEARRQNIQLALETQNFAAAFAELQVFRKSDPKIFVVNNYDYLLGRIAEKQNNAIIAVANFQSVIERNSILSEYAFWHLSQIMRSSGNLMLERIYLEQLLISSPDSLLFPIAQNRLAESFYESQDYATAIKTLKNNEQVQSSKFKAQDLKVQNPKFKIQNRAALSLLGNAFLRSQNREAARNTFNELLSTIPNPNMPDDDALQAVRGLDEIDTADLASSSRRAASPLLAEDEHWRRATIYQFNRDFERAAAHYRQLVEHYPNSFNQPNALFQLGRMASQQDRFDEAITLFERVQGQFPAHPAARDALSQEAAAYAKSGNVDEAVSLYRSFIEKYVENTGALSLQTENPERPFLNIIDSLRDKGRNQDALEWVRQTREKFKGQLPAAQALFSKIRIHLAEGNWNASLQDLIELEKVADVGGARVSGGTDRHEIVFLKAFCLEQLKQFPDAVETYLSIPDGRQEYYGGRATERLKALGENETTGNLMMSRLSVLLGAARQTPVTSENADRVRQAAQNALRITTDTAIRSEMLQILKQAYSLLPAYKNVLNAELLSLGRRKTLEKPLKTAQSNFHRALADELLFLNLYDEAAPELEEAQSSKSENKNRKSKIENQKTFTLAVFYKRGNLAHRAVSFAEPLWKSVPADYVLELAPRDSLELLYPAPYVNLLRESTAAPRNNVDPRFVLSIMRQESRFQPDAKSNAAARGLMQFIPSTANQIAVQLGQTNFSQSELYNPLTAILLGSQYLSNIYRQFPDQPQAVAAAYNGGESNMLRWLVRSHSTDPDRYVAEIQFPQSKDYVFKVSSNYRVYKLLYDETLAHTR